MAADPSIYNQIGANAVQPINPLTQFTQAGQAANALFGIQALAGRAAQARAYQSAPIDPATGLPDSRAMVSNLAADPRGGWAMPEAVQQAQEQQQRQFGLNKAQLEQTTARTNVVNSALTPLIRLGAKVQPQDVFEAIHGLHASGMPTDEFVQDAAATLPVRSPGQSDASYGQALQGWVVNHAARSWDPATASAAFTPKVNMQDTGGQLLPTDMNPYTNPGIVNGAPIGRTLSPGEQAAQVPGPVGPQGQKTVIPQAGYAQQQGLGNLVPGGGARQSGGASSPLGTGRLPQSLLNPNKPGGAGATQTSGYAPMQPADAAQPASPPAVTPQAGTPMAVGLGPAQQAGLEAAGRSSAEQLAALQNTVGGSAGRIYQLQHALGDLQALGTTGTGPGTAQVNNAKSFLQSVPGIGSLIGQDPQTIANYDEANKALTAYAAARAGAHGGTTDQQLATTLSSNASTHISNLAAQDVVKANLGLERMDQAQIAGFQQGLDPVTGQATGQPMTPDQFSNYSARWNSSMDPRAFIADQLTKPQMQTALKSMQPAERTKFQRTFDTAVRNGWVGMPAWVGSAPAAPAQGAR